MSVVPRLDTQNLKPVSVISGFGPSANDFLKGLSNPIFIGAKPFVETPQANIVREMMYRPDERYFAQHGEACVRNGWSIFPQVNAGGSRKPAIVDGESIRPSHFEHKLPGLQGVRRWAQFASKANVAHQLGSGSGHTIAIDIDIDDEAAALWVTRLALRMLGVTGFQRQGRAPRMLLIYRQEALDEDAPRRIRSKAWHFQSDRLDADGKPMPAKDAIEILSDGRAVTLMGAHHSTGDYFTWAGGMMPTTHGPDLAPVVTRDMLDAFLDAVHEWTAFHRYGGSVVPFLAPEVIEYDGTVNVPSNKQCVGTWEKRGLGKIVVDGRQGWIFKRAGDWVRLNGDLCRVPGGAEIVTARIVDEALRHVARTGKWNEQTIRADAEGIAKRTIANLLLDRFRASPVFVHEDGTRWVASTGVVSIDGMLGADGVWLAPAGHKQRRSPNNIVAKADADHQPNPARAKALALLSSAARVEVGQRVASEVRESVVGWLKSLWEHTDRIALMVADGVSLPEALRAVGALIAPTGAGKTSTVVREFTRLVKQRGPLPFALAMFPPSHANAAESVKTAMEDPDTVNLWDETVAAAKGLRVLQYRGKVLAGCLYGEQMAALNAGNVSPSGMCRQEVWDPIAREKIERICDKADVCPAMAQMRLAQHADLILMPHAYLTSPMPKVVKDRIGAIIVDERFWPEWAKVGMLPVDALRKPRKAPYLTKTDRKLGTTALDYTTDRDKAGELVTAAILAGECPANFFNHYSFKSALTGKVTQGLELVRSAKTVCARAQTLSMDVKPEMTMAAIRDLLAKPEGEHVKTEWRFWALIEERILTMRSGRAKHRRDIRIKLLRNDAGIPTIRLTWRGKLNFSNLPAFLLDASADPRILSKVFAKREVKLHIVDAPLHLRCIVIAEQFSDVSIIPDAEGNRTVKDRARAAHKLAKIRHMLTRVSALYANSRVLFGSTLAFEKALNALWAHGPNVDTVHYGGLRGLDIFKHHDVAISVGRMELPIDVLDGYVACLTYDEDVAEPDWNHSGTGWDGKQRIRAPQGERRLQRRDGAFITIKDSVYPDTHPWHATIQRQFREEELRQFAGRLRPVYRADDTAPLWICAATCVPDGIVVDDVVRLDDILQLEARTGGLMDIVRRNGGVLDTDGGTELYPEILGGALAQADALERLTGRELAHFTTVRVWSDGNPMPRVVRIVAWVPDVWQAIYDSERRRGRELDRIEAFGEPQGPVNPLALSKEPSKVDRASSFLPHAATATMTELLQERADREAALRDIVIAQVKATPPQGPWSWSSLPLADGLAERDSLDVRMILALYGIGEDYKPPEQVAAAA